MGATAGLSVFDLYMHMMIFNMLTSHSHAAGAAAIDGHAVHSVIGIPDSVAADAHIDTGSLRPEFSDTLGQEMSGISPDFNDAAIGGMDSLGSFDVPSIDVSVPDISVPDISIDVGSIDIGGGGGGFDVGGF